MNILKTLFLMTSVGFTLLMSSCGAEGNHPGYEYMPNMYRSPSYETYGENPLMKNNSNALLPVEHTVARGFMPFEYDASFDDYIKAGTELTNPLEQNEKHLAEGKVLYQQFCMHCHGKKGDGKGSITHPVFGNTPSYQDKTPSRRPGVSMSELTDGHIYHTITYGLNAMGPHASQLLSEERWKIVQYVHELQKGK